MKRMRQMRVLISLMLTVVMLFGTVPGSLMHVHAEMHADMHADMQTDEMAVEETGTEAAEEAETGEEAEVEAASEGEEAEEITAEDAAAEDAVTEDATEEDAAVEEATDESTEGAVTSEAEMEERDPLAQTDLSVVSSVEELIFEVRTKMKAKEEVVNILLDIETAETFQSEFGGDSLLDALFEDDGTPTGGKYLAGDFLYLTQYSLEQQEEDYLLTIEISYRTSAAMEAEVDEAVRNLIEEMHPDDLTDYGKISWIHRYLYDHVTYDYEHLNDDSYQRKYTPYAALFDHTAVCQGYALLFYRLCREVGIQSDCIVSNSMNHMWNTVKLGDLYYFVDATWDADNRVDDYFLKGSLDFAGHDLSDTEYSDSEYALSHPLAATEFTFAGEGMTDVLGYAPELTLHTIQGGTISSRSENGKSKVIVFIWEGCDFGPLLFQDLGPVNYDEVDVVVCALDMIEYQEDWDNLRQYFNLNYPVNSEITFCMQPKPTFMWEEYYEYIASREFEVQAGIDDGWVHSPAIFIINPDNQIIYASHGCLGDFAELIRRYTGSNAPSTEKGTEHTGRHSWVIKETIIESTENTEGRGYFVCSVCKKCKYDLIPTRMNTINGQCGDSVYWTYHTDTKELVLYGSGRTWEVITLPNMTGWLKTEGCSRRAISETWIYMDEVEVVRVEEGVTELGGCLFSDFTKTSVFWLPESLKVVGTDYWNVFPVENGFKDGCDHTIIFTSKEKPTFTQNCMSDPDSRNTVYYPSSWSMTEEDILMVAGMYSQFIPYDTLDDGWVSKADGWHYYQNFVSLTGWQKISGAWYYMNNNGVMQTNWQSIDGSWYYFGSDGAMKTGWQSIGGKWYFFNGSGIMASGWKQISGKWYYLNNTMVTGWKQIDGGWYYFGSDGAMMTGWQSISGKWYYLNSTMVTGWRQIDGTWYYFGTDGAMKTDWVKIGQVWYYFGTSGAMAKNWKQVNGTWYYFGNDGAMKTDWKKVDGGWYYFGSDGAMRSGWAKIDGVWYYFDPANGNMMASSKTLTISGKQYTFASNGAWVE